MSRRLPLSCLVLVLSLAACEADSGPPAGDADSGGAPGDAGTAGEPCLERECGDHGLCVESAGAAQCVCDSGYAGRSCGRCAPGFGRDGSDGECAPRLSDVMPEASGDACVAGGVSVRTGLDLDGNGRLDPAEVDEVTTVCAQPAGAPGPGPSSPGPDVICEGAECLCAADTCGAHGTCVELTNGTLCVCDAGHTGAACDQCDAGLSPTVEGQCAAPTRLSETRPEPRGARCPEGGWVTQRGDDLDGDGVLDVEEVESESYACQAERVRTGNVTVNNQASLDLLRGVTRIEGTLTVTATDVLDLDPLAGLTRVGGLVLDDNPNLADVAGLSALREIDGPMTVTGNLELTDLEGLALLQRVGGNVELSDNVALQTIDLGALEAVAGDLFVRDNPELVAVEAAGLRTVGGSLLLRDCALLSTVGFPVLRSVGADVAVLGLETLESLDGLPALESCRDLRVAQNQALVDVDGLTSLRAVRGNIALYANAALHHIDGLNAVTVLGGAILVRGNPVLVRIAGLTGVPEARAVGIRDNPQLTTVTGLQSLEAIVGNPESRCPYPFSVEPVCPEVLYFRDAPTEALQIVDNPLLTSWSGPGALKTISGRFQTSGVPELSDLSALAGLHTVSFLDLWDTALTSLPFAQLTTAFGIELGNNDHLLDLDGLSGVSMAPYGSLTIEGNDALERVDGFTGSAANVAVVDNVSLPTCAAEALAASAGDSSPVISGNDDTGVCP